MDRQAKINRTRTRDGRVSEVRNLEVNPTAIHPGYKLEWCDGILSETGKLEIFRVVPKSGSDPSFVARWDQGPEELDIDMRGASNCRMKRFKAEQGNYKGHHPLRTADPSKRIFTIDIRTPETIFAGTVSFSNTYEMAIVDQLKVTDTCDAEVIRPG
ncbi:hypothetical protein AAFG07_32980 [Bradyrhizobium sp. B097]|uniref:hypothetical protein n=1 Tax=Bradyrhizobium sp. B097 TaxID=3140244 RepID=UPI0031838FC3